MTERLTLKKLSDELDTLRTQVLELERQLEQKIEARLDKAVASLRARPEPTNLPEYGASIDAEQRQRLIEEEAYLIAEQRGFQGGDPAQDWARAEQQVNDRLMQAGGSIGESAKRSTKPAAKKPAQKKPAAGKTAAKASRRAK